MRSSLTHRVIIDRPIEAVWAYLLDPTHLTDFAGYGPIPGIASARVEGSEGLGMRRIITNTDGSTHREEVIAYEPPRRIVDRIDGFDSPVRLLARHITDEFRFEPRGEATELVRTFEVELRSPLLWPIARVMRALMARAIARHHASAKAQLEAG